MSNQFTGFTKQTIQFFKDLEVNNTKEWFDENRKTYENEVRDRMKELCVAMTPAMKSIDVDFELRPHRCISRINRDTRFSKDKSPYKTHMWMSFMQTATAADWVNFPGFFLELSGSQYVYGTGMYAPKRFVMDDIRDHISYRASEFREMTQKTVLDRGFSVGGEEYKRPIKNDLEEYFQQWYHRKGIFVIKTCPIGDEVFSNDFQKKLEADYKALEWLYNFLKESQPE